MLVNKSGSSSKENGTISSALFKRQMPQKQITFFDRCIIGDVQAFLDYSLIKKLSQKGDSLAIKMDKSIKSYTSILYEYIKKDDLANIDKWLEPLNETKYTGIGYSSGKDGNGVGRVIAKSIRESLVSIKKIVVKGNDSFYILPLTIENIGNDRSSDIITAITKRNLIEFTEELTIKNNWEYKIVKIHKVYNTDERKWISLDAKLPLVNGEPVILFPKQFINTSSSINSTFNSFWRYLFKNFIRYDNKYISYRTDDRNYITVKQFRDIIRKQENLSTKSYIRNYALKDYAVIDVFQNGLDNVVELTDHELEALQYCRVLNVA